MPEDVRHELTFSDCHSTKIDFDKKMESHISDSVSISNRHHRYRIGSHSFNCQNFQDIFVKIWPMSKSLTLTTSSNPALKDFREFAEIEKVFKSVLSCGPSNTNPRNLYLDRFMVKEGGNL